MSIAMYTLPYLLLETLSLLPLHCLRAPLAHPLPLESSIFVCALIRKTGKHYSSSLFKYQSDVTVLRLPIIVTTYLFYTCWPALRLFVVGTIEVHMNSNAVSVLLANGTLPSSRISPCNTLCICYKVSGLSR